MTSFKYDKEILKGENAEKIEKIIEQAVSFGKANVEIDYKNEIENTKSETQKELETLRAELNSVKNREAIANALSGVPEKNKKVIEKLIEGDPTKVDEIKKEYSQLFEEEQTINLSEVLNGNIAESIIKKSDAVLADEYRNGAPMSSEEEERVFEYLAKNSK